jgi:glycosyltransferase involved in cell wall biosynthesis
MVSIDVVVPVYKPSNYFRQTLIGIVNQKVTKTIIYKVIVVDDGSCDAGLTNLISEFPTVNLITLTENVGRSKSRNKGAYYGDGDFILFIDADCHLESNELIEMHCKVFEEGYDVSFGTIKPQTKSGVIWVNYLDDVERKRCVSARKNKFIALTSGHFAIRRKLFLECNGFDERYEHYGFEDRDLIATLIKKKAIMKFSPDLVVRHDVEITLLNVCRKMEEAGQYTARLFANKYPRIYSEMLFSHFDINEHPYLLKIPLLFAIMILPLMVKKIDKLLEVECLPKWISYSLIKIFSALAFLKGTSKAVNLV